MRLRHDPRAEPPISLLGFDALHDVPPLAGLAELFAARAAPVKAVLLDQSFSAGVGNWIADEVLYQARIDPRRRTNALTRAEIVRLGPACARSSRPRCAPAPTATGFRRSGCFTPAGASVFGAR